MEEPEGVYDHVIGIGYRGESINVVECVWGGGQHNVFGFARAVRNLLKYRKDCDIINSKLAS